jgi:hypothetical protein
LIWYSIGNRNISFSIAMGYGRGSIPGRRKGFFSTLGRLWSPPSLLYIGYLVYSDRGVKVTTHIHLVPRSIMVEFYLHTPIRLNGVVLR